MRKPQSDCPITPRQRDVLNFLIQYIHCKGYPPTVREIGAYIGVKSPNTTQEHLCALEAKKFITRESRKGRTITVLNRA
jgi:repressor LexA